MKPGSTEEKSITHMVSASGPPSRKEGETSKEAGNRIEPLEQKCHLCRAPLFPEPCVRFSSSQQRTRRFGDRFDRWGREDAKKSKWKIQSRIEIPASLCSGSKEQVLLFAVFTDI